MAASPSELNPNGAVPATSSLVNPEGSQSSDTVVIKVKYDKSTETVTVTPCEFCKGDTVRFTDADGGTLKVAFLSAMGKETETYKDSEECTLVMGGVFHFKCYFGTNEYSPEVGGVIDVTPHMP